MPKTKTYRGWLAGVVLAGVLLVLHSPVTSVAQDQDQPAQDQVAQDQVARDQDQGDQDPPSRVARMNYTQGSVSFQPGGEGDWVTAVPNRPLTTGDNLWSDQGSRAEMHIGSTAIRLAPETSVTFLDLDDRTTQLRLSAGTIILRVRHLDDGDVVEVDTPNLAFNLQHTGEYRLDVDSNGDMTNVSVFSGRGEVTGGGYSYTVVAGQSAHFSGTDQLNYDIAQLPRSDDFDNWAFERDHREDGAESANYVSPEMTGYEDLDDYGRWQYVGGYGTVWVPAGVASDWAPYRNGHWAYIDPWGWTWVEDEPWGFCPFHFGRWVFVGAAWGWIPGPIAVTPIYTPALVAFLGGVGFSSGSVDVVAWFPLGPHEPFFPWYHYDVEYLRIVNITNVRNVTKITNIINTTNVERIPYKYRTVAATAVPATSFGRGDPVAHHIVPVNPRILATARVVPHPPVNPTVHATLPGKPVRQPPVQPVNFAVARRAHAGQPGPGVARSPAPTTAEPRSGPRSDQRAAPVVSPRTASPRFVMRTPPPPPTVPFTQRRQAMIEHPGRPLEPQQLGNLRIGRPAGPLLDREIPPHVGPVVPSRSAAPPARERRPHP